MLLPTYLGRFCEYVLVLYYCKLTRYSRVPTEYTNILLSNQARHAAETPLALRYVHIECTVHTGTYCTRGGLLLAANDTCYSGGSDFPVQTQESYRIVQRNKMNTSMIFWFGTGPDLVGVGQVEPEQFTK